jgi:peptidoglycan glycosyltransferase
MNAPLRKAGVVMMILFGLLFVNLNWIQVYKADEYRTDDEHNAEYSRTSTNASVGRSSSMVRPWPTAWPPRTR